MPQKRSLLILLLFIAAAWTLGLPAPAAQAADISYQVVSSKVLDKIDNSQDGTTLKAPEGGRVLQVRLKLIKTKSIPDVISNLDYTLHYMLESRMLGQLLREPTVRPCEGLRWQGTQVNENGQWLLVSEDLKRKGGSLILTQVAPGTYYLDLAFIVHQGMDEVQVYAGIPQGLAEVK